MKTDNNMRKSLLRFSLLLLCLTLSFGRSATAQTTGARLSGSITDSTGAVVPHASVIVQNTGTNLTVKTESNDAGFFVAANLPPGQYSLTTEATGFTKRVQSGITLTVGQDATLNVALQLGSAGETVNVEGGAEMINATSAEISQVINENSVKELPLNGRDPSSLVFLSGGVTNELQSQAGTTPGNNSFPTESGASAGGQRQGSTWYLLDGVANMDMYELLAAPFPNADATQEFRVISNNFDARYGFAPSAVVSIQTKTGTNSFHGGAFEFIRNSALNAGNYFSKAVDPLKRNQFGGYLGGPIFKDKLFFFANYQGTRQSLTSSTNSTYTPTAAMLRGDFSAVPVTLTGPFATINGVPNQVDPALFSPGAVKLAALLPLGQTPSTGLVNYVNPASRSNYDEGTARMDYNINANQRVFLRSFTYSYILPGATIPGNILAGVQGQHGIYINEVANHTWTMTSSLLNSITVSYSSLDFQTGTVERDTNGNAICLSEFINVNDPATSCNISGLSAFDGNSLYGGGQGFAAFSGGTPNDTTRRSWWLTDTVTKTLGRHTIVVGTDLMHRKGHELYGGSVNPSVNFNGQYTNNPLSDFLLGDEQSLSQGAGESGSTHGWMVGLYAQDQFKFRQNITLTAGLRWDPNFPLTVVNGRGASFVPGQQSTRFANAPVGLIFPGDKGLNAALMPTTYGYFQPRIGVAWQAHPDTVIRAGFGLFTTPLEDAFYNQTWDAAPFSPSYNVTGTSTTPISFDNPWAGFAATGGTSPFPPFSTPTYVPASNVSFTSPINLPAVFAPNYKLGITQSWNLSLEQQFGKTVALHLAYVGAESFHQATTVEQNPGNNDPTSPLFGTRYKYTSFSQIKQVQDGATSHYSSLQAGLEKRLSHGIQVQSNFTWSRTTDVGGSGDPQFESSVSDPLDLHHDYGLSSLNYPLISVTNFIYEAPKFEGHNVLVKNTLGGWEVSGLFTAQSGSPFTINGGQGNNNSGFLVGQDRADVVPGQNPGIRQGSKSNWINHYINANAFVPNAAGTPGNSEKFEYHVPPIRTMDLALIKNWAYEQRYKLQFRVEMFNALNHPSFGQPDSNAGDSNFGQITSTGVIPARVMQGGLKLSF